jgi:hypothetical protein
LRGDCYPKSLVGSVMASTLEPCWLSADTNREILDIPRRFRFVFEARSLGMGLRVF